MATVAATPETVTTRHVTSAGARVFVRETGTGFPCLVVHGGLGLDHSYLQPLDALEDVLRLAYVDLPGNGRSDRIPLDTLTIDRLVDALEDVRAALGHERVLVAGHSYGALLAQEYALRHPQRVAGLLLMGAVARNDFWDDAMERLGRRDPLRLAAFTDWPDMTNESFTAWLQRALPSYCHGDGKDAQAAFRDTIVDVDTWARGNRLLAGWSGIDRLHALRAPTLVLHGKDDLIPVEQARLLHEHVEGSRLVEFERSGHFPYLEEPAAFFGAVRRWLADHKFA